MVWIESHANLSRHPKTLELCSLLDIDVAAAVGYLHLLWHWAAEFAVDGDLTRYTAEDIADAAYWEGDPDRFVSALVQAGFLDQNDGRLVIHDWEDYGPWED